MAEYINRKTALENIKNIYELGGFPTGRDAFETINNVLATMSAADVVEVVRCKDCKYGEVDNADFHDQYLCNISGSDWNCGNHFCGYGERKEGAD